jgi:hypothetical protein
METVRIYILAALVCIIASCSKKAEQIKPAEMKPAVKALLVSPDNNAACVTGVNPTPTQSTVKFSWQNGERTDTTTLVIKNLLTGAAIVKYNVNTNTEVLLPLNTPYSWWIISKSNKVNTAVSSEAWKFYNAGAASTNYAPFPPDAVMPLLGEKVSASNGKIVLQWETTDIDKDVITYDVYFGTNSSTPDMVKSNLTTKLFEVNVILNTLYYWKITARDSKGNTSTSALYTFIAI